MTKLQLTNAQNLAVSDDIDLSLTAVENDSRDNLSFVNGDIVPQTTGSRRIEARFGHTLSEGWTQVSLKNESDATAEVIAKSRKQDYTAGVLTTSLIAGKRYRIQVSRGTEAPEILVIDAYANAHSVVISSV